MNHGELKRLDEVSGWKDFTHAVRHLEPTSYLYDVGRFCHKVYAQLGAFESEHRYVVWLDADTVAKKEFGQHLIKDLLDGEMCAYLGREKSYTETGFIAFDTEHEDFPEFERLYRAMYDDRRIFLENYWIDCMAFDSARRGLSGKNLTPEGHGMMDVFSISPLKDYFDHDKGARKFK